MIKEIRESLLSNKSLLSDSVSHWRHWELWLIRWNSKALGFQFESQFHWIRGIVAQNNNLRENRENRELNHLNNEAMAHNYWPLLIGDGSHGCDAREGNLCRELSKQRHKELNCIHKTIIRALNIWKMFKTTSHSLSSDSPNRRANPKRVFEWVVTQTLNRESQSEN